MDWEVIFYQDAKGKEPVVDFLDSLAVSERARVTRLLHLLAQYGVLLKEPHTRQIRGKLRELRIMEKGGRIRVFYFGITGRKFVLLHGFVKKTAKTPAREIDIALKRMDDFIRRYGG
jgi:phage-related protein